LPADVEPVSEVEWDAPEDAGLFDPMVADAKAFMTGFDWCHGLQTLHVGVAIPGVVAVFLAQIVPGRDDVDEWLWVVVGDLPPAYLVVDDAPDSKEALRRYIELMAAWVAAARAGQPTGDLIPVNVNPTPEAAEALASRLRFLATTVLER